MNSLFFSKKIYFPKYDSKFASLIIKNFSSKVLQTQETSLMFPGQVKYKIWKFYRDINL